MIEVEVVVAQAVHLLACGDARRMDRDAVNHRIGPCEIDVLEHAETLGCPSAMLPVRGDAVFAEHDDFARIDIADKRCSQRSEGAAF